MSVSDRSAETLADTLIQCLRRLGEAGEPQAASRLAAEAWTSVRHEMPLVGRRLENAMHHLARLETSSPQTEGSYPVTETRVLDVRSEAPVRRHALIFDTFEGLEVGSAFELVNDHDPKPLYYQLAAEQPGTFSWEYLEQGPVVWRVCIGRTGRTAVAETTP